MKLNEVEDCSEEILHSRTPITDPCRLLPFDTGTLKIRSRHRGLDRDGGLRETQDPYHLILVADEEDPNVVSYHKLFADGHLGSVTDDC